jgi:hypothetical protein
VPILDYHQRVLCPDVWSQTEQSLSPRASVQIDEQVGERFPRATAVYLIGDMTGHYWTEDSDLDLLIRVDPDDLPEYREEAQTASGYKLTNTDHIVNFFLLSNESEPSVIAKNFGPLYDLSTGTWIGQRNLTTNEFVRPSAVIQYINWRLFKVKRSLEIDPYDWKVLMEAYRGLSPAERDQVLKMLKGRVKRLEHAVSKHLEGQPKENWKLVDELERELDDARDLSAEYTNLPRPLLDSVLHAYRYDDLVDTLEQVHETMSRMERTAAAFVLAQEDLDEVEEVGEEEVEVVVDEDVEVEDLGEETNFWKRIDLLVTRICQTRGGFANSSQTIYEIFAYVLEGNKFVKTKLRQRDISLALYHKFYRGSKK